MKGKKAFPHNLGGMYGEDSGMDLRDYFAACAMHGILAGTYNERTVFGKIAGEAYQMAAAMMKERRA